MKTIFLFLSGLLIAFPASAAEDFPIVPDDFDVSLFAREPLVRNPCALTFDAKGRLCVGMGPQYRAPKPETPGDSVWILIDEDNDGVADSRREFAKGFNAIQGLAWKGRDLWVANAPELTIVRDLNGDDVADEYVRVFTDLGNLEHALHGLNFGPDGKLYMSKGNSKGLTEPGRVAPAAFRELWGVETDLPTTPTQTFAPDKYRRNYHTPADDWGTTGGILRCDDDGSNLEIVARGFRNPWDICFDDGFNWLGTDNDQTMGDKIFAPFFGAHFGWGHAWSYDWKGDEHLPTAPSSGPLFEGSGAGVVFCGLPNYPEKYRDVFLINDWLRREIYVYRPMWDGAWMKPRDQSILAHAGGGRSMPKSSGRSFDPVDIEIGPDGAIWIGSWGRQYGAHYENDELANEGRIYRIWPKSAPPDSIPDAKRETPIAEWTSRQLLDDLGSHLPVWRTNAQEELIRRKADLSDLLERDDLPRGLETWTVWTQARANPDSKISGSNLNRRIQKLRAGSQAEDLSQALSDPEPRIRLEAVLAIRQAQKREALAELLELISREEDRVVFYAAWGALIDLQTISERKQLLSDERPAVRRGALLSLLEVDALTDAEIRPLAEDPDPDTARIAAKRLDGKAEFEHRGRPIAKREKPKAPFINPFASIAASSGRSYRAEVFRAGSKLYADRPYQIKKVPAELEGLPFLQTACGDADPESGISVTVDLKYPATVYLADDARAEALPGWARDGWEPTKLSLEADDPPVMRFYKREVPAGPLTLGTNRDGVRARKGNYILVVRPKLLDPTGEIATVEAALEKMAEANPERGRDLFLSSLGANCVACHQMEGLGNVFAPDLAGIGERADAAFLIESMIEPSAAVTEGFATQIFKTKTGKTLGGIVVEETGAGVLLAMSGGATIRIPKDEIVSREGSHVSPMPMFSAMLSNQQIADIAAYLLRTKTPPRDSFDIVLGGKTIATYLVDDPVLTRRAFVNVRTPSGIPVTREWPAPKDDDHATMHPGLWIGFGWISGNDYWRLQSKVVFEEFLSEFKSEGQTASFATRNRYLNQAGDETVCLEDTAYEFELVPDGVLVRIDATFFNDERDFVFGDQEESGLAIRMAKPLTVQFGNGRIVNDRGERDGAGTWGKPFEWIDYSGEVDGKRVGILIVPHPENPGSCWSHSRDYGALVANPFPRQPKERREPYVTTPVKKGERFRLRYAVLIHESEEGEFDPAAAAGNLLEPD